MRTVDIPGGTATLRESEDLRARDTRLIRQYAACAATAFAKMPPEVLEGKRTKDDGTDETDQETLARLAPLMRELKLAPDEAGALEDLRWASILASLASWTRPEDVPTTFEELGNLPAAVVTALDEAVGGLGAVLKPEVDFTPSVDPESPTTGSSD